MVERNLEREERRDNSRRGKHFKCGNPRSQARRRRRKSGDGEEPRLKTQREATESRSSNRLKLAEADGGSREGLMGETKAGERGSDSGGDDEEMMMMKKTKRAYSD